MNNDFANEIIEVIIATDNVTREEAIKMFLNATAEAVARINADALEPVGEV